MKKSIIGVVSALIGGSLGAGVVGLNAGKLTNKAQKMSDKHLALFLMMNQWVKVKQEGKKLEVYFKKYGYNKVAIYGMSYVGETLLSELKNSQVKVEYGIDKNASSIYTDIDVVRPDEILRDVDAIVVTSIYFFDEIEEQLSERIACPIVSLEDILYEV